MSEKAVIDRFEEDLAVLLVGEDQEQYFVALDELPEGARPGHWLQVEVHPDDLVVLGIDFEETERVRRRIEQKLRRLRRGRRVE